MDDTRATLSLKLFVGESLCVPLYGCILILSISALIVDCTMAIHSVHRLHKLSYKNFTLQNTFSTKSTGHLKGGSGGFVSAI